MTVLGARTAQPGETRGPSPLWWRPKAREASFQPRTRPTWPTQASVPSTVHAAGHGAPRTDARARPISGRLRSEGRRRGQPARRWRGRGGSCGSSREAEPRAALASLLGAVRLGLEAACGLQQRPGPTSQSSSPALSRAPAATLLTPCLTSCGHRDRDGNPKRELQPTLPTPAAAPPHIQTPAKWRGGKGGGHSACASEAETRGGARDRFWSHPYWKGQSEPRSGLR